MQRIPVSGPAVGPEAVQQALERLRELPSSRRLVQKAIDASNHPLSNNSQLQAILSVDAGAAADILRLANSPFFGVGARVRTLSMAITVIGHERLRRLLQHLLVADLFGKLRVRGEHAARVWTTALVTGTVCHAIGGFPDQQDPDHLLIGGLLHNVGELALLSEFPDEYQKAVHLSNTMTRQQAERAVFGMDSAEIGGCLLELWSFPENLCLAATSRYEPDQVYVSLPPLSLRFIKTVQLGAQLADAWTQGLDAAEAAGLPSDEILSLLRIPREKLGPLWGRLAPSIDKLRQTFSPNQPEPG
jgi:HD-like signal output (HDOD) protein